MKKTTKAPSTLIREQATTIQEQAAEIEKLKKDLENMKRQYDSTNSLWRDLNEQKEEIHTMLDCLPDAPARRTEPPEGSYRSPVELTLIARITVWVANLHARAKA